MTARRRSMANLAMSRSENRIEPRSHEDTK